MVGYFLLFLSQTSGLCVCVCVHLQGEQKSCFLSLQHMLPLIEEATPHHRFSRSFIAPCFMAGRSSHWVGGCTYHLRLTIVMNNNWSLPPSLPAASTVFVLTAVCAIRCTQFTRSLFLFLAPVNRDQNQRRGSEDVADKLRQRVLEMRRWRSNLHKARWR